MSTVWFIAPLAAGSLVLSTDWAQQHDPFRTEPVSTHSAHPPAHPTVTSRLQQRVQRAAQRVEHTQVSLARLETAVQLRSAQLTLLDAEIHAAGQGHQTGSAMPTPAAPGPATAPLPAPVAVPAAPPVSSTTGAS